MLLCLFGIVASCFVFAGTAHADWHEARSRHFIIYADGSVEELRHFATKVETFDSAVRVARGMSDPPLSDHGRLTIYALKDAAAVARIYGDSGNDVDGFYEQRASGSIAFVSRQRDPQDLLGLAPDADILFFHEYFHHIMLSDDSLALPAWVVEGFAEFFSTATIDADGGMLFGRAAKYRAISLFGPSSLSLAQILGDSYGKLDQEATNLFYARSWLLTHFLFSSPERQAQLNRYVAEIQAGKPAIDSAREAFGDLKQLDRTLDKYLNAKTMTGYGVPANRINAGPIELRTMTAGEAAIMPVRMRSDRGVNEKTAPDVVRQARAIGARYPGDAFVQGALAEAEFDVGDFPAAIAAADRALAVNPKDVQALIYKGRALLAQAAKDKGKLGEADWAMIRSWFVRANRLEPEYAEPLMLYYQSYKAEGVEAPEAAIKGLLYAMLLAPGDESLRMSAVIELIQRGRLTEAKTAFVPIAYNPHLNAERRDRYAKVMEAIAGGRGSDAITLINAPAPETAGGKRRS